MRDASPARRAVLQPHHAAPAEAWAPPTNTSARTRAATRVEDLGWAEAAAAGLGWAAADYGWEWERE